MAKLRAYLARELVRVVALCIEESYRAYMVKNKPAQDKWSYIGHRIQTPAFYLARKLDKNAAVDQMINECWWG